VKHIKYYHMNVESPVPKVHIAVEFGAKSVPDSEGGRIGEERVRKAISASRGNSDTEVAPSGA
jgi:hypothetical protein